MSAVIIETDKNKFSGLPTNFNKKKFFVNFTIPHDELLIKMQNLSKKQCLNIGEWQEVKQVDAWMISAETATFMNAVAWAWWLPNCRKILIAFLKKNSIK